jgi:hypothetical protein
MWLPIETAPKGLVILYYPPTTGRSPLRFMIKVDHADSTPHRKPTHWMPLPSPPDPTPA